MRKDLNCIQISGTIVKNPELSALASGSRVAKTSVAVHSDYRTKNGEDKEVVGFFDIEAWAGTADTLVKWFPKGKPITIVGQLIQQRWEKDGKQKSRIFIKVSELLFARTVKEGSSGQSSEQQSQQSNQNQGQDSFDNTPSDDDDIPF